ncbi:hypothetical protein TNCV_3360551 [Trichonephila clavipes]|nr:hypothetical protein TNCV_3360551 [Trichonephila clavipes]
MADKLSAANHDAKEYGTFSNAQETCVENNEKQQVLESYLYRGRIMVWAATSAKIVPKMFYRVSGLEIETGHSIRSKP